MARRISQREGALEIHHDDAPLTKLQQLNEDRGTHVSEVLSKDGRNDHVLVNTKPLFGFFFPFYALLIFMRSFALFNPYYWYLYPKQRSCAASIVLNILVLSHSILYRQYFKRSSLTKGLSLCYFARL